MLEVTGNLWDFWEKGEWIVITVNGTIKKDGSCVMGRGVAKEAALRFPKLPLELGKGLREHENISMVFGQYQVITFPVKHNWWERADLELIKESAEILANLFPTKDNTKVYMVRPGCGNGGLKWEDVKPVIAELLGDNFIIVEKNT